jgi:hypothetical protein
MATPVSGVAAGRVANSRAGLFRCSDSDTFRPRAHLIGPGNGAVCRSSIVETAITSLERRIVTAPRTARESRRVTCSEHPV